MENIKISGCGTALVTPFNAGAVDYEALVSLLDKQFAAGIDFIVPLGSTAETPCLENDEKLQILECCREQMRLRAVDVPVVVGVGTNSLAATLRNIRMFSSYADALLVVVPYYNKPTQEGQYRYFREISEASDKPIILYNVPGRTGINMEAETCLRIAYDCPNVIGIKEASSLRDQIIKIIEGAPNGFSVFSGNDDEALDLIRCGAAGVISVASNIAPRMMTKMVANAHNSQGEALNESLKSLYHACFVESNPIPVKAGLAAMGLIRNELRLPLVSASAQTYSLMSEVVKTLE